MLNIQRKWRSALIFPKVIWTIVIALIYMFGKMIPVSPVSLNETLLTQKFDTRLLDNLAALTGAEISSITLFSLGISPWMTAMIIWRFFNVMGWFKHLTSKQVNFYRNLLSLAIALIQAFGLTAGANFQSFSFFGGQLGNGSLRLMTILILIAGSFVLSWLGSVNSAKGLGGMMIIILVNMILSFQQNSIQYFLQNHFSSHHFLLNIVIFLVILSALIMLTVVLYRAEYRIPIKRIGINSAYSEGSYLPIRITPAGAMPFMYGMTLMMLPPYILSILSNVMPKNEVILFLIGNVGISQLPGVIIYIVVLYVLAIGFSYYNYDAYDIAKNMRQNGDYIISVTPGEETRKYLQNKINILAQIGAMTVIFVGAGPLFVMVLQNSKNGNSNVSIALLISNAYIIASLLLGVIEQVETLQNWKKYKNII